MDTDEAAPVASSPARSTVIVKSASEPELAGLAGLADRTTRYPTETSSEIRTEQHASPGHSFTSSEHAMHSARLLSSPASRLPTYAVTSFSHYMEVETGNVAHPDAVDSSGHHHDAVPSQTGADAPYNSDTIAHPAPLPNDVSSNSIAIDLDSHPDSALLLSSNAASPPSWSSPNIFSRFLDDLTEQSTPVRTSRVTFAAISSEQERAPEALAGSVDGQNTYVSATVPSSAFPEVGTQSSQAMSEQQQFDDPVGHSRTSHLDQIHTQKSEPVTASSTTGYVDRRYKLKCIEITSDGAMSERLLSRAEIMQEARATLPTYAPSPKAVGRWLGNPQERLADLQEFSARFGVRPASKKAMQKALRNYLRNSLQPRDIRQVDPAFSAKPALWVRHSALVVSLEGVRAIILHDKMFLFDPNHPVARTAATVVRQSVMTSPELLDDPHLPFEFKALEGIFIIGILGLEREFNLLKPEIDIHLHELPNELTTKMLEELRINKQKLHQFLARAHSVRDILEKILDEDEDMANMYLTEKHASPSQSRNVENHDEVEMLLEAYMQVIDELVNRADLLNNAIEDTEDLVMIHLDTLRNRLLSVDLALNIFSMCFAFGGCLASLFGMNITIPLYESSSSKYSFLVVVLIIVGFAVVVPWLSLSALRRKGLFSIR
jgi:Mg2+ and Co2+ transporter CorA